MTKDPNVIKKSEKVAMACPQCREQFPNITYMEEELIDGVVKGYTCPDCAYHVDAE